MSKKDIKKLVKITANQERKLNCLIEELEISGNEVFRLALNKLYKEFKE